MDKLDGKTFDVDKDNIEKMKELFPDIFTEGKIDMDKFIMTLGEHVEKDKERYEFTWNGKTEAIKLAQKQTTGTLRPCKEESVNWDSTQNLFIEGDNLEVLRILQSSYRNKVKLIYIDPPYNTGNDFIYKDDFHNNVAKYREQNKENMKSNPETNGRFHTDWLNMIYPRLKVSKNILTNDGLIVVHIDEHEESNLEKVLNDVFGETNKLGKIIWNKRNPKGDSRTIAYQHESLLVFAKNKEEFLSLNAIKRKKPNAQKMLEKASSLFSQKSDTYNLDIINQDFAQWLGSIDNISGGERAYNKIDDIGKVYRPVSMAWPNKKKAPDEYFIPLIHPLTGKKCPVPARGWRNPPNTMRKLLDQNKILFGEDETTIPNRKYLLEENMFENVPSILDYASSDDNLFSEMNLNFDNPKPYQFSRDIISFFTRSDEIVLDFFAGSSTTAHAVMDLNAKDKKTLRYIMVQLPEETDEKSQARKEGYNTISQIGKERIRRASQIVKREYSLIGDSIDIGFKVFKLDDTNLKAWDEESLDLEKDLMDMIDPVKEGRTQEDVVYEVLLKYGVDLTVPIEQKEIAGKAVYDIGMGYLLICLERDLTLDIIERITKSQPARVVFYDEGFKDDTVRTNAQQILKRHNVEDIRVI